MFSHQNMEIVFMHYESALMYYKTLPFQYYDPQLYPSMKEQKNFEKNVFNKTHKADSEF